MLADDRYHIDWLANAHAIMLASLGLQPIARRSASGC